MPLQPGEAVTAENHYYIVTLANEQEVEVTALGWANLNGELSMQDPTGAEVRRFANGEWATIRPMPHPEGEES
jgi:hypothetical protein